MYNFNLPSIASIVSVVGLLLTMIKILMEQKKYHKLKYQQDKRLEYKLRIYEILLSDILPIDQIITKFNNHNPLGIIDHIEIRKCIYEMIVEKTLVSFEDGSYTVDTVDVIPEEKNDNDEFLD